MKQDSRDSGEQQPIAGSRLWKITAVVSFGPFLAQLDTTVVNVSLSTLSTEFNAPLATVQWVATGYLLALALMIPMNGWLVDRVGAKRVYLGCFGAFTAASGLCGMTGTIEHLVAFRVLQGMAGGLLAPMAQLMVARYAGPMMARMLSWVGLPVLIAPIFGPSIAGAILHFASWHWLFYMNIPLGIAAVALAAVILPSEQPLRPRRLDVFGFLLVAPGLVLLLYGLKRLAISADGASIFVAEVIGGIGLLAGFVVRGLRQDDGLINMRLFAGGVFATAALTQFLANATVQGGQMLFPLYLLTAQDMPPSAAGLLLAPMGLGLLSVRPLLDRLIRSFGPRHVSVAGATICIAATLPFASPTLLLPSAATAVALFIRGFGLGMVNMPSVVSAYSSVPRSKLTDAATALNIVQRLGGPCATMAIALLLHRQASTYGSGSLSEEHLGSAFPTTFGLLCLINLLCLLSAMRLPRRI